jgi:hypothetical protein
VCVRCGTGRVAWCTDPMRHGDSAVAVAPGEAPVVSQDVAYTLTVHDQKHRHLPDQVVGVFAGDSAVELAKKAASEHWEKLAEPSAMPLEFKSYDSSHTGHDFHVATGYRDYEPGVVEYSVNGFTVQR